MQKPTTFTSSVHDPRDRGLEFGERFRDEITATVASYRRLFLAHAESSPGEFDVDHWAEKAWMTIARRMQPQAAEIEGIAEGSGLPVRDIASINARTELLVAANPTGVNECSTVVSLPKDGAPFGVQTWDWYDAMSGGWLHWTIPHPDGRRVETVTEFGMLGKIGVNDAGVGVMLNMLHHKNDETSRDEGSIGYPVHLLSRRIMDEARSFEEAAEIAALPTSASTSLTVVDRAGRAATFELFPGGPGRLDPTDGVLVRTNNFVSPEGESGCLASTISESSSTRLDKLRSAFAGGAPATPDDVLSAMTDHEPGPDGTGAICCHPDRSMDPVLQHRTLATVVLDVEQARLDVRPGGPCGDH